MNGGCLFVKRDDLSSPLYGGNKIRKLEHLIGEAIPLGAKSLIATGRIGSSQALAIAIHGQALGLNVDLSLFAQPVTQFARVNLLGMLQTRARILYERNAICCFWKAWRAYAKRSRAGEKPYFIPSGATTRLGNIGYVSAGLELAQQVKDGLLPEPNQIFVAAGSCGTAAGLIVGLKLAGLRSRVIAVRTFNSFLSNNTIICTYAKKIANYLHELDRSVPEISITQDDFQMVTDYFGDGYGVSTEESRRAIEWALPLLHLETTYTGKALAACLDYCRTKGKHETVLFWNTVNSAAFAMCEDTASLSENLHRIFLDSQ